MTSLTIKDFDNAMNLGATNKGAVSKLVKAWEAKNDQSVKRAAGLGLMAVSLAACDTSSDDSDDGDDDTDVTPVSMVLTDNADIATGTSGNDTFSGASGSIDGDTITAGDGTDTMSVTVSVADDDNASFVATDLEVLEIRGTGATGAAVDLDLGDVEGLTSLVFRRMSEDVTVTNLLDLDTVITIENTANTVSDVIVNFEAATVSGDDDTANLTVDSTTSGADFTINGVETIAVTAVGTDNDLDIDGDDLETVTIAGSGDISIDVDASVTTFDASDATGDVTMVSTAAADVEATGGTGDDVFQFSAAGYDEDDVVDGGTGSDTLNITAFATVADEEYSSEGIEVLQLESAAVTMEIDQFSGYESFATVQIDAGAHALVLSDIDSSSEVLVTNSTSGTDVTQTSLTLTISDDTGTDDSANVTLTADGDDTTVDLTVTTLSVDEIETLNLELNATSDGSIAVGTLTLNEIETLTVTGAADAELGSVAGLTIETIDASAATGDIEVNLGAADSVVTGGDGDDTFTFAGNLDSDDEVDGGDGDDTLSASLAAGTAQADLSNVETIVLDFGTASATFSGSSVTGATLVEVDAASDEAVTITNLADDVATVRVGATAAGAAGDAVTVRWASGSDGAHEIVIGDNTATAAGDVDTGILTISGNDGDLTITSDAFTGNSVYQIAANDATSLSIVTEEDLEIDTATGNGQISATSALAVSILTDGGDFVVDETQDFSAAETIVLDAADGNITLTGAMTATDATSLTVTATDDFVQTGDFVSDADLDEVAMTASGISSSITYAGVLDVDHAVAIALTAEDGGTISIADIELLGVDSEGDDIDTSLTITATGTDSADTGSTVTVSAMNTAAATLDLVTIVGDADSTVNFTTGGANLTITEIDASAMEGDFTFSSATTAAAIDLTTGAGTNDITTELNLADEVTLADGDGSDTINVLDDTTAADVIYNFEAGDDGDVISIDVSALVGGAVTNFASTALNASLAVSIATDADGVLADADNAAVATDNILMVTNTFANVAAVMAAVNLNAETNMDDLADNDAILVLWSDGADSYLSTLLSSADDGASFDASADLIQFVGVSVSDLTADNFAFV